MKPVWRASTVYRFRLFATLVIALSFASTGHAQVARGRQPVSGSQNAAPHAVDHDASLSPQSQGEEELRLGTALTRRGSFSEAIPHLLAARGQVANEYAASFNLALCYVAIRRFTEAIHVLSDLRSGGHDGVDVENLLAQAYVGNAQPQEALASLQKAASLAPQDEKLYSFVIDACTASKDYGLGLKVVELGLSNLPQSARLHYQRALLLTQLDEFDQAKPDFDLAGKVAQGSELGYLASAQEELLEGDISAAVRTGREAVKQGYDNHALLAVLGEALIRSGVNAGEPEFAEATTVLEKAVEQQSNDATSQIALGSLYLAGGRLENAIAHLEKARELDPDSPSVYSNLARAYQRHGDIQQAQDALATLQKLNRDQAARIGSAPGDRKMSYGGRGSIQSGQPDPHR